jgi:hypothetical protein
MTAQRIFSLVFEGLCWAIFDTGLSSVGANMTRSIQNQAKTTLHDAKLKMG